MATMPSFKYGTKAKLPSATTNGRLYFTTDTDELYADYPDASGAVKRHKMTPDAGGAQAYKVTLTAANWSGTTYTYANKAIKCGTNGDIPPIITYTTNQTEYNLLTAATANPGTGITFTASSKPVSNIDLIIIDFK